MDAVANGEYDTLVQLLAENPDLDVNDHVDAGQNTPLIVSSMQGHADMVQVLLDHGASIDVQNEMGYTALMAAVVSPVSHGNHLRIVRLLCDCLLYTSPSPRDS